MTDSIRDEVRLNNWYMQNYVQVYLDNKHVYRVSNSDIIVPGTTTLIKKVVDPYRFLKNKESEEAKELLEWQGKLGSYIHLMIELDLTGKLDESSIVPPLDGYFESWLKIKRYINIKPICMEKMVFDIRNGYAGTMDLRALVTLPDDKEYRATIDFKSGKNFWDHWRHQPPAYFQAFYADNRPLNKKHHQYPGVEENGLFGEWDLEGRKIRLPVDYEKEIFIVIMLKKDGSMAQLKVWPKDGDSPYQAVIEWMQILTKYHYQNGGWDAEKLLGKEYAS